MYVSERRRRVVCVCVNGRGEESVCVCGGGEENEYV
jgi:hypothetical protein